MIKLLDLKVTATVWNGSIATQLGTTPHEGQSSAWAINNAREIVGDSFPVLNSGKQVATKWNGTTPIYLDTPSDYGAWSSARGINNIGQVIGFTYSTKGYVATVWNDTTPTYLGTIHGGLVQSMGLDINDAGQSVGYSAGGATLWNSDTPTNLNDFLNQSIKNEGWKLTAADAINNNGVIVGRAVNTLTGMNRTFILSPAPEPETYAMMLCGLGLVSFAKRRRNKSSAKA